MPKIFTTPKTRRATCPEGHTHELLFAAANPEGFLCPTCQKKYPNSDWTNPEDYLKKHKT